MSHPRSVPESTGPSGGPEEVVHRGLCGLDGLVGDDGRVGVVWRVEVDVDVEAPVLEGDRHVELADRRSRVARPDESLGRLGGGLDDRRIRRVIARSVVGHGSSVAARARAGTARTAHRAPAAGTLQHLLELLLERLELLLDAALLLFERLDAHLEAVDRLL